MTKEICFATHNSDKVREVRALLQKHFHVLSLNDIGIQEDIPETSETIPGNALQKAEYVFERKRIACFADDSGLEVRALNGAPGVDTAYYAGPQKDNEANIDLLLKNMEGVTDRYAQFVTVIAYISKEGKVSSYRGTIAGEITRARHGKDGFGYDPVFVPEGYTKTFAELPLSTKNKISHRALAIEKFLAGLVITDKNR